MKICTDLLGTICPIISDWTIFADFAFQLSSLVGHHLCAYKRISRYTHTAQLDLVGGTPNTYNTVSILLQTDQQAVPDFHEITSIPPFPGSTLARCGGGGEKKSVQMCVHTFLHSVPHLTVKLLPRLERPRNDVHNATSNHHVPIHTLLSLWINFSETGNFI